MRAEPQRQKPPEAVREGNGESGVSVYTAAVGDEAGRQLRPEVRSPQCRRAHFLPQVTEGDLTFLSMG